MGKVLKKGRPRSHILHWQVVFLLGILTWIATGLPALFIVFLGSAMAVKAKEDLG